MDVFLDSLNSTCSVGGFGDYDNGDASSILVLKLQEDASEAHMDDIMEDLGLGESDGWRDYDGAHD